MSLRVFLVGDYRTGSGPANVTAEYKKRIENVRVLKARSKPFRVLELLLKMPFCDVVLLSGHSGQNVYAIKIAHRLHKKAAFLMHGCVEHENRINGVPDDYMTGIEREVLEHADAVYAVSTRFADWLKEHYPQYAGKICAVPNGIDLTREAAESSHKEAGDHTILSIGGGMKRKQIVCIAKAVMILREDPAFSDAKLIVIGKEGKDTEAIDAFPCVEDLGCVPFEKAMELLKNSALFVQNSCFETFGLAPMEALKMGASVLLSDQVGALELFGETEEGDLIRNTKDPEEIAWKMKNLLLRPNRERLLATIDTESVSWDKRCKMLMQKLQELAEG